jgi:uncharacterized protein YdhG (YjbR/CyaY superfamily)
MSLWRAQPLASKMRQMNSTAPDVSSYIAEQPEEWRATLTALRAACQRHLDGYVEAMAYGMPSYLRVGQTEVAFAKQARYLSLYILRGAVLEAHRSRLVGLDVGKGCIRYRRPDQLDWEVIAELLSDTAAADGAVC